MIELRPVDKAFAQALMRRTGATGDGLAEAIAGACWAPSDGHLCIDLTAEALAAVQAAPSALGSAQPSHLVEAQRRRA